MTSPAAFHEVRFPLDIALGASGGPERHTEIVTLASGHEERNARWADSRRRYNAGYGVKSIRDLHQVIDFFEERRGRLYGFRWKDRADDRSCPPGDTPSALDQEIAIGDGNATVFQLRRRYGADFSPWYRTIVKPVADTVRIALDGTELVAGIDFDCDAATGLVTFATAPAAGVAITAGFEFDVPVRFDTDFLEIGLAAFEAGEIPSIPLIEIRP